MSAKKKIFPKKKIFNPKMQQRMFKCSWCDAYEVMEQVTLKTKCTSCRKPYCKLPISKRTLVVRDSLPIDFPQVLIDIVESFDFFNIRNVIRLLTFQYHHNLYLLKCHECLKRIVFTTAFGDDSVGLCRSGHLTFFGHGSHGCVNFHKHKKTTNLTYLEQSSSYESDVFQKTWQEFFLVQVKSTLFRDKCSCSERWW